jgi:large subunit ribosomal protein L9
MAHSKYEVILEQDVPNLGKSGDLVKVRPGFARNYLIPQHFAVPATTGNKAQVEHQKRAALARAAKLHASAEAIAKRLAGVTLPTPAVAGDDQRLYGAVTTRDISIALKAAGVELDHKTLKLAEPIKRLGSYDVTAKLSAAVSGTFKVNVIKK